MNFRAIFKHFNTQKNAGYLSSVFTVALPLSMKINRKDNSIGQRFSSFKDLAWRQSNTLIKNFPFYRAFLESNSSCVTLLIVHYLVSLNCFKVNLKTDLLLAFKSCRVSSLNCFSKSCYKPIWTLQFSMIFHQTSG